VHGYGSYEADHNQQILLFESVLQFSSFAVISPGQIIDPLKLRHLPFEGPHVGPFSFHFSMLRLALERF
jgi:hypothetical protein